MSVIRWRNYAGLSFWECAEQKYSVFFKIGKSSAIDYLCVWFYFYPCFSQSIETSQENNEKCKPFLYQEQPISCGFDQFCTVTVDCVWCVSIWNWKFIWKSFPICNFLSVSFKNTYANNLIESEDLFGGSKLRKNVRQVNKSPLRKY